MTTDEFTDAYSDDILYLLDGRKSLLTHPLRTEIPYLCNASFCRLYIVTLIGSIEFMLEHWRDRDSLDVLSTYFSGNRNTTNKERMSNLCDAFIRNGITVNRKVFNDYLAIKYIRNAIVHSRHKPQESEWILECGFPVDIRKLDEEHLKRLLWVNENMMLYIAKAGLPRITAFDTDEIPYPQLPDTRGIISSSTWPSLYYKNLERISAEFSRRIEEAATSAEFSWSLKFTPQQIQEMSHGERKQHFYVAAQNAARQDFDSIVSARIYIEDALVSWSNFSRQVSDFNDFDPETLHNAIEKFRIIQENGLRPRDGLLPPLRDETPLDIREKLIESCFENVEPLTARQIAEVFLLGERAYRSIRNITPLVLFSIQLPLIDPERCDEWTEKASYIADIFEIGRSWYAVIEGHESPPETTDFYRQMSELLSKPSN